MRKLVLVGLFALLWAAPANAKEMLGAQLCGPAVCASENAKLALQGPGGPFDGELVPPAHPGAWYRGYLLAGDQGKVIGKLLFYYVPGDAQVVQPGRYGQTTTWTKPSGKLASLLARLAERVKPYAGPNITSVTLGGKRVQDPDSYLRLWTIGSAAHGYPRETAELPVIFNSEPASPWSDANYMVAYPKERLLLRDGQIVSLSRSVAARLARGESLNAGGARRWLWALVVLPVAALGGFGLRRRREP